MRAAAVEVAGSDITDQEQRADSASEDHYTPNGTNGVEVGLTAFIAASRFLPGQLVVCVISEVGAEENAQNVSVSVTANTSVKLQHMRLPPRSTTSVRVYEEEGTGARANRHGVV